ncbi:MAG: redox-sensing transcriptional repressor Rex [Candidatus Zipacnadales bacterium]
MTEKEVPDIVVRRLPLYLRALTKLAEEGYSIISSQELGVRLGVNAAQIRKDLSYFGGFGKQGTGYDIAHLCEQLQRILKVDRIWDVILIGVGDLGHAILHYNDFRNRGYRIVAAFDRDPAKVGQRIGAVTIQDVSQLANVIRERNIQIAIIAVPAASAQQVADQLVASGIRAILSYAPITLHVPPDIRVYYIDPVVGLQSMTYYLKNDR